MNPSASYLTRSERCPASQALPHANVTSPDAKRGTAGHRYLERAAQVGPEKALAEVSDEHREMCAAIDLDGLPLEPGYRQEVALAFYLNSGRGEVLGCGRERRYGERAPHLVYGTADVLHSQRVEVLDYKFDGFESHHPAPAENPQLLFLALAYSRVLGLSAAQVGLIHIRPDGSHWQESAELDAFDLDAFELRLRHIIDGVRRTEDEVAAGRVPSVSRGPWCRYCPASASCPAVTSLVRAVAGEPARTAEEILALLTPETAARAYMRLHEVLDALKPVSSALYMYASEHDVALPDGRIYGTVDSEKEAFNARKTRDVLAKLCGPEVAEAACKFTTSKTAVKNAVNANARKRKERGEDVVQKELVEAVLAEIQKAGGVARITKSKVRLHRVGANGAVEIEPGEDDSNDKEAA